MEAKILFVEDEITLAEIVKENLLTQGFEVFHEADGNKAIALFDMHKPDLCILDVMLPGKDGFKLAQELKSLDPAVPIIFLTAQVQTADVIKGLEIGADDYIKKPFSIRELIARIHALLRRERRAFAEEKEINPICEIGRYSFDVSKQLLSNGKSQKQLTHREAELLKMLYLSKNEVLDRNEVLMKLWGDDSFYQARSMDVFISKLRKYLKNDPNVSIINVRGFGYKLIC